MSRLARAPCDEIPQHLVDGNKRTAFVASVVFLEINGRSFRASEEDVVVTFLALAAGEMTEARLAKWFAANA